MSTFSGVGGLELGLDERFEIVGLSEIYPSACDVLRYHNTDIENFGDITKIDPKDLPDFDMLVGGSPCQSLSTAGTRSGFKGKSKLFFDFVNLLKEKNPSYFLWENVSGTFTSTDGYDFLAVLNSFHNLGYNLQWQLVNSADLGSAQARSRVFVVGAKNKKDLPGLIDIKENDKKFKNQGLRFSTFCGSLLDKNSIIPTITRSYGALSGNGAKVVDSGLAEKSVLTSAVNSKSNKKIRLLTPIECERLMSWPDNHTAKGIDKNGEEYLLSDGERYKACGNGIVSLCVREILKTFQNYKIEETPLPFLGEGFYTDKEVLEDFLKSNKLKKNEDFELSNFSIKIKSMKMAKILLKKQKEIKDLLPKIKYNKNRRKGILLSDGTLLESFARELTSTRGEVLFKDVVDTKKENKKFLSDKECSYLLSKLK